MIGVHNSQPQDNGLRNRLPHQQHLHHQHQHQHQLAPGVSPNAGTQRPGETTSLSLRPEQLPPAHSACQLAGRHHGNHSWRAGWRGALGRPPRPLPGVGCPGRGMGAREEKSASPPPPFLPQEAKARVQSPHGALCSGVWGCPASALGAHRLLRSGTPFPRASLRERSRGPSLPPARSRPEGARPPHPPTHPAAPAPSSALPGCTPSSPAPLTPARAWRRRGHSALAEGRGGKQRGRGGKGGRAAQTCLAWLMSGARPSAGRPVGPRLSLLSGSGVGAACGSGALRCPGPPPRPPASPPSAPRRE